MSQTRPHLSNVEDPNLRAALNALWDAIIKLQQQIAAQS